MQILGKMNKKNLEKHLGSKKTAEWINSLADNGYTVVIINDEFIRAVKTMPSHPSAE